MPGEFLKLLFNALEFIWPVRVVWSYELGVRFIGGYPPKALRPGIYLHIPFFMKIEKVFACADTVDLPFQSLTTKDGKTIDVSANLAYHIVDAVAYYTNVRDFDENFPRLAARHVASRVRGWSYDELMEGQSEFESSLRDTMNTRMKKHGWGVVIDDAGLTDFVITRQFRLH